MFNMKFFRLYNKNLYIKMEALLVCQNIFDAEHKRNCNDLFEDEKNKFDQLSELFVFAQKV